MTSILPAINKWSEPVGRLQVHRPAASSLPCLPHIEWRTPQSPVLRPSPLGRAGEVVALNLAMGCAHRCAFCSARAYPRYPGDQTLYLYSGIAEQVVRELRHASPMPSAVFVSPSTDPFPPVAEVQAQAKQVVDAVASQEVNVWLMTRGHIRPSVLDTLSQHRNRIKVTIGLTTLDRPLQRLLEPLAAPPRLRLRQIRDLKQLGISVHVALEPLLPGVTDTRSNLTPLLDALAGAGVTRITASYLFLRPGIRDNLSNVLENQGLDDLVSEAFRSGPVLKTGPLAPAQYLPKSRRQRGYAAIMALAANYGISVSISATTNPDFQPASAAVTSHDSRPRLLPIF